jgi:hypothetical protein
MLHDSLLFDLFSDPEDGGHIFLQNVFQQNTLRYNLKYRALQLETTFLPLKHQLWKKDSMLVELCWESLCSRCGRTYRMSQPQFRNRKRTWIGRHRCLGTYLPRGTPSIFNPYVRKGLIFSSASLTSCSKERQATCEPQFVEICPIVMVPRLPDTTTDPSTEASPFVSRI